MAFTFIEPFEEGDRQTNNDTGVEYIYVDGAWRALGPKIEDEFPTLDDRYVNKTGDTMTGGLKCASSIELNGASDAKQTIIAQGGFPGHLSYDNNNDNARRISWGSSKVWIRRQLDLVGNSIIGVSGFILEHANSTGKKFIIKGESTRGANSEDFFYSYRNADGTLDAMNYTGKQDSANNLATVGFVEGALQGADFDSYVNKAGDTMTGHLSFELAGIGVQFKSGDTLYGDLKRLDNSTVVMRAENSKNFKIQARDTNGNSRTFFDAQTNSSSGTGGADSGYRCKIYHLADPTSDLHATNQRYVKSQDELRVEGKFKITNSGGNYYIEPN